MLPNSMEGLFTEQEPEAPSMFPEEPTPEGQNSAMSAFDLPIPGQSLTAEQGQSTYEQPPQYTDLDDAVDHIFERMIQQDNVNNLLRIVNTGIPLNAIIEPVLLHGAQEGLWNIDMSMMLYEPVAAMIIGLANMGGANVNTEPKKKKPMDISAFEKMAPSMPVGVKRNDKKADVEKSKADLLASVKRKGIMGKEIK
jgi:hypothetical protein